MIVLGSRKFKQTRFEKEEELEGVVQRYCRDILGENAIYLPQKVITTGANVGTIPDAIVVDPKVRIWYIVEVELAKHGTWQHIVPQVSKEIVAADNPKTRELLSHMILSYVEGSNERKEIFTRLSIPEIKIHSVLDRIMGQPPIVAIIVDEVPADLKDFAATQKVQTLILKLEKYVEDGGGEPAYMLPELPPVHPPAEEETETEGKWITEEEFLAKCDEPGRVFYHRLKQLALSRGDDLRPKTHAFSYYVRRGKKKFCPLVIWPDGITILKWNLTARNGIPLEANSAFFERVGRIAQMVDRLTMQEPGLRTREGDVSPDDINLFVSAFEDLLNSITKA